MLERTQRENQTGLNARLAEVADEAEKRLVSLDEQVNQAMADVRATISDVENMPTKTVDWIIREAGKKIVVPTPSPTEPEPQTIWKSPVFDAAGARGLQLELRAYGFPDKGTSGTGEDKANCSIFLRAAKGTHIAFRLAMGPHSQTFERKFNTPTACFGTSRLCFVQDYIDSKTDTLRIKVEVLESVCELDSEGVKKETTSPDLSSVLKLYRHVNNRVLSQVKSQVDHFRALSVRHVEWRLEEASTMKRAFPRGTPMTSKEFDAAGIAGLQLVFYPSGHDCASEGFCSLYLSAPQGATVRCSLQAGRERRELTQTFDQPGQFGRANFCRFESCQDEEEDTVLIVLEIEDAHQDLVTRFGQMPPANAGIRSLTDEVDGKDAAGPPNASQERNSAMKLQMMARTLPAELQETKVLPSLWSSRNKHDPQFDAMRSTAKRAGMHRAHSQTDTGWRKRPVLH
jgi:hypothetical protein